MEPIYHTNSSRKEPRNINNPPTPSFAAHCGAFFTSPIDILKAIPTPMQITLGKILLKFRI